MSAFAVDSSEAMHAVEEFSEDPRTLKFFDYSVLPASVLVFLNPLVLVSDENAFVCSSTLLA